MRRLLMSLGLVVPFSLLGCGEGSHNNTPASAEVARQAASEMPAYVSKDKATRGTAASNAADMMKNGFGRR